MQTNRLSDHESARLKQLRSQRQKLQHTFEGRATPANGYEYHLQPFSPAPTMRDFSLVGDGDVAQQATQLTKVVNTPVLAELSPLSQQSTQPTQVVRTQIPAELELVSQKFTRPIEAVRTQVPTKISPNGSTPFVTTDKLLANIPASNVVIGGDPLAAPAMPESSPIQREHRAFSLLITWLYRVWLICATALLALVLLWLQVLLDRTHFHPSTLRTIVQWAELIWLTPMPLAIILWAGWFIFAQAARPDSAFLRAPVISQKRGLLAFAPPRPVRLVFRIVTRGDNVEVLRDSVLAVHQAFARYKQTSGPYGIEIISECPISHNLEVDNRIHIYVVPPTYVTRNYSRFKARALTYLQEQVRPRSEDWYIYLDEESLVDEHMLAGVYRFIWRSIETEQRAQQSGKKSRSAGLIGQGAILYQGGNWFFRGADGLRTADDLGRFRVQYALGIPMFGIHGSFIVVRGIHDTQLTFDVGTANSITEDAAWALHAWALGFRFAWVDGYLHEQPPQTVKDFIRQRSRWLSGIRAVLSDRRIPFRYRCCLGIFTLFWQLAFLPFLVAVVALFVRVSPFPWMRLPADFAWATYILAYLQGIDIQSRYPHPFLKKNFFERQVKRALSWLLVLCSIWYSLLEAIGVIYSFKPKHEFFVIQKPSLATEKKKEKLARSHQ